MDVLCDAEPDETAAWVEGMIAPSTLVRSACLVVCALAALKPIKIEMKRAAGHNKTHVSGLESFCISPNAVADALKKQLGCTTAVLKLPGNNTKDMEVLLQGHCVQEVVDYLRDVYCIDKQWLDLKLKESKRSNT